MATLAHPDQVFALQFSPNGERLVVASWGGVFVWDTESGRHELTLVGHGDKVDYADYSPDGKLIVTASKDGTARVWDAASGEVRAVLRGHRGGVWQARFDASSARVVTASQDRTAAVFEVGGRRLATFEGHGADVFTARFSPDGRRVVTASDDGTVGIWEISDFYRRATSPEIGATCGRPADQVQLDGRLVSIACPDLTRVWDPAQGKVVNDFPGADDSVIAGSHDLLATSAGREVVVRELPGGREVDRFETGEQVSALAWSPVGRLLASASADGSAVLIDYDQHPPRRRNLSDTGKIRTLVFTHDGQRLVTADNEDSIRILDVTGTAAARTLTGAGLVDRLRISPDDERLVTLREEDPVLWDLQQGRVVATLPSRQVINARFDPHSTLVVTLGGDGSARVWDANTGALQKTLSGSPQYLTDGFFDPTGAIIATSSGDGAIRFWDLESGRMLWALDGHGSSTESLGLIDAENILSRRWNGDFEIWKIPRRALRVEDLDAVLRCAGQRFDPVTEGIQDQDACP
jgi:WD40 repeat protein